ncbi:MAG: serine/threonine protein kinase [Myxococcales bacterium]|nr:serine/threonine protein kinase [Myxococcales bacterium]
MSEPSGGSIDDAEDSATRVVGERDDAEDSATRVVSERDDDAAPSAESLAQGGSFSGDPTGDFASEVLPLVLRTRLGAGSQTRLGRYRLLRLLGEGGMGAVFAAYDEELDRKVAIKLLRSDARGVPLDRGWLLVEAKAMARISHPNVVQIYDVGEASGQVFVAMEYIEGTELSRWLADEALSWAEIIDVFIQAGRGLQAAHEAGVVHRDFKPDNVMIRRRQAQSARGEVRAKVLDFGLAAVAHPDGSAPAPDEPDEPDGPSPADVDAPLTRLTATGALMGTPRYMSPEQFLGADSDPRSDQFSFAVALYEALFGERPFAGESFSELREAVLGGSMRPPPRASDVPGWARETLLRALALDPNERWASMDEFLTVLAEHPARTLDPANDRTVALRQRILMFAGLGVSAVTLLAILLYLRQSGSVRDFADYAFWSKVLFAGSVIVIVLLAHDTFRRHSYNRRIGAMLVSIAVAAIAASISAQAIDLPPEAADRFVLTAIIAVFGQASASVDRWYIGVAALGLVGLALSFMIPFLASLTLGLTVVLATGVTTLLWRRRSRTVASTRSGHSSISSLVHRTREPSPRLYGRDTGA